MSITDPSVKASEKPRRPWPWGPGPKPPSLVVHSSNTVLPDLNDASFMDFMNRDFENNFIKNSFNIIVNRSNIGASVLDHILCNFQVSDKQKTSLEQSDLSIIASLEHELEYIYASKALGQNIHFSSLGLNPDNCPGLPLESILVRRDTTYIEGMARASSKIVLLRGHLPVKPDKPDKPPPERPTPEPKPTPGREG